MAPLMPKVLRKDQDCGPALTVYSFIASNLGQVYEDLILLGCYFVEKVILETTYYRI